MSLFSLETKQNKRVTQEYTTSLWAKAKYSLIVKRVVFLMNQEYMSVEYLS